MTHPRVPSTKPGTALGSAMLVPCSNDGSLSAFCESLLVCLKVIILTTAYTYFLSVPKHLSKCFGEYPQQPWEVGTALTHVDRGENWASGHLGNLLRATNLPSGRTWLPDCRARAQSHGSGCLPGFIKSGASAPRTFSGRRQDNKPPQWGMMRAGPLGGVRACLLNGQCLQ